MKIGIIGSGNVGKALGEAWVLIAPIPSRRI